MEFSLAIKRWDLHITVKIHLWATLACWAGYHFGLWYLAHLWAQTFHGK